MRKRNPVKKPTRASLKRVLRWQFFLDIIELLVDPAVGIAMHIFRYILARISYIRIKASKGKLDIRVKFHAPKPTREI
ncbi:MAG: hypothetical protein IBGAMO2_860011 [Arenicellales bacterium IbO2]|nr:MAG: hypothetical protein IBGAMO2_860011 [Arenicellales bacterium IbO2]